MSVKREMNEFQFNRSVQRGNLWHKPIYDRKNYSVNYKIRINSAFKWYVPN